MLERRERQPDFLTASPSQALTSSSFSKAPVRSCLVQSDESGSFVLYPSLPARQWVVTKLVRTPAASTAFHEHVEVVTEVLDSWSCLLSEVSLILSLIC